MADPTRHSETLSRGLSVLAAINVAPPTSIARIMQVTGLPKATVMRLMATLRADGYVEMLPGGGGFRPLPKVRLLSSAMALRDPVQAQIETLLRERVQQSKWPLEFLMPDGDWMTIRVTTRGDAPIGLRRVEQTRFPILTSASGMAMLAAMPAESLAPLLARVRGEILYGSDPVDEVAIRASLIRARNDGFAVRDYFLPAEGSRLLAVATLAGGRPVGALAMAYLKDAVPHDHVALRIVPLLRGIAAEIGDIIRHYGGETWHAPGSCPNTSPEEIEK